MNKKIISLILIISMLALMLTGCGSSGSDSASTAVSSEISSSAKVSASSEISSALESSSVSGPAAKAADAVSDDFASTLSYIKKNAGKTITIDYSKPVDIDSLMGEYKPSDRYLVIEKALSADDRLTRTRITRKDDGGIMDVDVYRSKTTYSIDKIVTTEYGSSGRMVSGWYFKDQNVIYEYQYTDDLYGTEQHKKEVSLDTETASSLMDYGYITYDAMKQVPGYARVYGYVGDEYGGILKNVSVTIKSAANSYVAQTETNGDGLYEFYVPINEADYYNISFTYGDFVPDSLDDLNITPGTTEYSCGEMYMASKGQNKHETDIYLMNINKKAPDSLKDGEYEAVLTYDNAKAQLKPYSMNLSSGKTSSDDTVKIKVSGKDDFKYYVTDSKNGKANNMAYDMSKCDATVTVYDSKGIAASYLAPAAHAGVVWEVFAIRNGKIIPVNNYYTDTSSGIFFK